MKLSIYVILLAILLTTACNSDKRINTGATLQVNSQTGNLETDFHGISDKGKYGFALPGLDHGLIQSPINILTKTVEHVDNRAITVRYKDEVNAVANLGHTIQLHFAEGSTIIANEKTFNFITSSVRRRAYSFIAYL